MNKCHNTGCNVPEGECTGECSYNFPPTRRPRKKSDMPVQFAGEEPDDMRELDAEIGDLLAKVMLVIAILGCAAVFVWLSRGGA